MRILNKKQIIDRYGNAKYVEFQEWLHGDGAPTRSMVEQILLLSSDKDEDVDEPEIVHSYGTIEFKRDCYGYVYLVDSTYPNDMIPAIFQFHNFGDRNNYVPDIE